MRVLDRVKALTAEYAEVENEPSFEGRQVVTMAAQK
jgi:translation initiation factor IF-3